MHIMGYGNAETHCSTLLDKAKEQYDKQNYAKSLEYLTEAKTIAESNNLPKTQIHILHRMAVIYAKILDYEKAMEYYTEAYQIVIKNPKEYKSEEMNILNNISQAYFINKDFDKAKEYIRKAYNSAIELQDSICAGRFATNLASIANQTGDLDEAEKYLNLAMIFKSRSKNLASLLITKGVRMENLYLKKEYNKAEQLALEILNQSLEISDNEAKVETMLILSRIYQQKKDYQKAIKVAKDALKSSPQLPFRIDVHEQLSQLYLEIDSPYLAVQYIDSMMIAKDSLTKITDMTRVMINQMKFDLINSEKALAENKAKQKAERILLVFILSFVVLFVLILVWVFRVKTMKNKQLKVITELELEKQTQEKLLLKQEKLLLEQEKLLLEQEKLLLEKQLKEREVLSLLEQQRLNNEIEAKNRQLTAKILFQSSRNELIKEIIHTLAKIPNHSEDPIPILKSVMQKLKEQVKESVDSESLLIHFEKINPSFLSALKEKHPDLTANDIRLLSYMYLNLDTKEISKLFNITHEYCRKKKQQLSKKMKIPTTEMYCYLTSIG